MIIQNSLAPSWVRLLSLVLLLQVPGLLAQERISPVQGPDLQDFARRMLEHNETGPLPPFDELLKVMERIKDLSPGEVARALPEIATVVRQGNDAAKTYGTAIVMSIGLRPDSGTLLLDFVDVIGDLLKSPRPELQRTAAQILATLQPQPPAQVTTVLLAFLKRSDRDELAQATALFGLLRLSPNDREIEAAMDGFLARPPSVEAKLAVLDGIASARMPDTHLTDIVITALNDRQEEIRFAAARALCRMPIEGVKRAKAALQQRLERADESAEVKKAVAEALERIAH